MPYYHVHSFMQFKVILKFILKQYYEKYFFQVEDVLKPNLSSKNKRENPKNDNKNEAERKK